MKIVVDTNLALSGLLWGGPPNRILKWPRDGILKILACEETTAELRRALIYKKFSKRISALETTPAEVFAYYMNLVLFVPTPTDIPDKITEDPFDNLFLGLASENKAQLIVSGDKHLLDLAEFQRIQIVTPSEACEVIETLVKER
jgi:putative PIN family toxin of toxin-antitoxin system